MDTNISNDQILDNFDILYNLTHQVILAVNEQRNNECLMTIYTAYKLKSDHTNFGEYVRDTESKVLTSSNSLTGLSTTVNKFEDIVRFCENHNNERVINDTILNNSNEIYVYQCLKYRFNGSGDIIKCANDLIESEVCRVFGNTGKRKLKDIKTFEYNMILHQLEKKFSNCDDLIKNYLLNVLMNN